MTKRISPLESSREIQHPNQISSNSETVGISRFLKKLQNRGTSDHVALGCMGGRWGGGGGGGGDSPPTDSNQKNKK